MVQSVIKRKYRRNISAIRQSSQAAITKYHRLSTLNNKNFISHSSGNWKSKLNCKALERKLFNSDVSPLRACTGKPSKLYQISFYIDTNPIRRVPHC